MPKSRVRFYTKNFIISGAMLASSACASFPPPTTTVASSLAAVRGAEEVGAAEVPQAALKLQLAREQLAKAEALMADGEHELAHSMALRASNDAELAIVLVRESEARAAAAEGAGRVDSAKNREVTP